MSSLVQELNMVWFYFLLKKIDDDPDLELQLLVGGAHLEEAFWNDC